MRRIYQTYFTTCGGKCVSDDAEMGRKESQQRQLIKMAYNFHDLHLQAGFAAPRLLVHVLLLMFVFWVKSS